MAPRASEVRLSILVFSRNDADHLRNCLETLVASPPQCSYEVRVFDNASEDESLVVLGEFLELLPLSWIAATEETSFSDGNNRLLAEARGVLVVFLNPDTQPEGPLLDRCSSLFEDASDLGLVSPCLIYPDGSHQPTGWHLPSPTRLLREHIGLARRERPGGTGSLTDVGWLMGCFLMGEREFLSQLDGFDEAFWFHGTDLELCSRVHSAGRRVARVEDCVLLHVGHQEWDRSRREAVHAALIQWLGREYGAVVSGGAGVAARLMESLR